MITHPDYRTIVFDIDGTLINDEKEISRFTLLEINRVVKDYGVHIILMSSRMPKSIKLIRNQINAGNFSAAYNGSLVIDDAGNKVIHSETITPDIAFQILNIPLSKNIHVGIFFNDTWVVSGLDYWALREVRGSRVWPDVRTIEQIRSDVLNGGIHLHKIMFRGFERDLDAIQDLLSGFYDSINVFRNKGTILEISSMTSSKSKALEAIVSELKIELSEVIAFGDSYNDIELIKSVGFGVAMDNAPSDVKAVADEITLSNNEDGVGLMLRKLFFSNSKLF